MDTEGMRAGGVTVAEEGRVNAESEVAEEAAERVDSHGFSLVLGLFLSQACQRHFGLQKSCHLSLFGTNSTPQFVQF